MKQPNVKTKVPFVIGIALIFSYSAFQVAAPPETYGAGMRVTQSEDVPASLPSGMAVKARHVPHKQSPAASPIQ